MQTISLNLGTLALVLVLVCLTTFSSVFFALFILSAADRRRRRMVANAFLDQVGRQVQLDQSFTDIIRQNFKDTTNPEGN